jgi:hypothetical protein
MEFKELQEFLDFWNIKNLGNLRNFGLGEKRADSTDRAIA